MTTTAKPYRMTRGEQGVYRGAVASAWRRECQKTGEPLNDKAAHKAWYVGALFDECGITSTKGASAEQVRSLRRRFEGDSETVDASVEGFTEGQNKALNMLASQALKRRRDNAENPAEWLDKVYASAGVFERQAYDRVESFDNVVAALAILANNTYWLDRSGDAVERRLRHLIEERCRLLTEATGTEHTWAYVRGIYDRMGLPLAIEDAPAQWLHKVFSALDMQCRRVVAGRSRTVCKPVAVVSRDADPLPF